MTEAADAGSQRLDKWLCYARFVKTRTLAQALIVGGKVRVNKVRARQPSHPVKRADVLTIRLPREVKVVRVLGLSERRVSAPQTNELYEAVEL